MSNQAHHEGRAGVGGPNLVGMNKAKDPSTIADNESAEIINMRVKGTGRGGGILVNRGGQSKVNDAAVPAGDPGCIEGIFPIDDPYPNEGMAVGKMWFNSRDNLFTGTPGVPMVNQDPPFHPSLIIGHHDGAVWLRSPGTFGGSPGFRVSTITDDETTHTVLFDTFPAGGAMTTVLGETYKFGGNIFIPVKGGNVPAIIMWDGAVRTLDFSLGGSGDFGCGPFFEVGGGIFAFINGRIYGRTGAGTWPIQTPNPVPFVALTTHAGLLYGFDDYNAGTGGYDIYTWDGVAAGLTLVRTIPVTTGTTGAPVRVFSFNGKLYYLYAIPRLVTGGLTFILGCYDGTTWDDNIFTFTSDVSVGSGLTTAWMAMSPNAVRGTIQVGTTPPPNVQAYCAASQNKNLAWFFAQNFYPNPQELYLYTDSGQRSKFFYFVD